MSISVGALVAALVLKAADKAGDAAVQSGAVLVRRLVTVVRDRFVEEGDTAGTAALTRVQDPPVGDAHRDALAAAIDAHVEADPAWAEELRSLAADAEREGVDVDGVVQQVWGDHNVTIGNVQGSTITIRGHEPPRG